MHRIAEGKGSCGSVRLFDWAWDRPIYIDDKASRLAIEDLE